jgi:hypothetical protein
VKAQLHIVWKGLLFEHEIRGDKVGARDIVFEQEWNCLIAVLGVSVIKGHTCCQPIIVAAANSALGLFERDHVTVALQPVHLPLKLGVRVAPRHDVVVRDPMVKEDQHRGLAGGKQPRVSHIAQRESRLIVQRNAGLF